MSGSVFLLVLLAALLHAVWNALVKGGADKSAAMVAVVVGQGLAGAVVLPFAEAPDPACLPWLVLSVVLHMGYQVFLVAAKGQPPTRPARPPCSGSPPRWPKNLPPDRSG